MLMLVAILILELSLVYGPFSSSIVLSSMSRLRGLSLTISTELSKGQAKVISAFSPFINPYIIGLQLITFLVFGDPQGLYGYFY
jgi:hypothetical protein